MTNELSRPESAAQATLTLEELRRAADVRSHLSEAEVLLAETRIVCRDLITAAEHEAASIVEDARAAANRIIADARAQTGDIDVRERSTFSKLWESSDDHGGVDSFFRTIPERSARDVYNP
ncbi:MAG: hypothetical protein AAF567_10300 [Actinomycetota bacterium]